MKRKLHKLGRIKLLIGLADPESLKAIDHHLFLQGKKINLLEKKSNHPKRIPKIDLFITFDTIYSKNIYKQSLLIILNKNYIINFRKYSRIINIQFHQFTIELQHLQNQVSYDITNLYQSHQEYHLIPQVKF